MVKNVWQKLLQDIDRVVNTPIEHRLYLGIHMLEHKKFYYNKKIIIMPIRKWKIQFLTQHPAFKQLVLDTLNSPWSWNIPAVECNVRPNVKIGIAPNRTAYETDRKGKKRYFSYTLVDETPNIIWLDPVNFLYGVKDAQMTVQDYRKYLINHEFGHVLGKDHIKCTSQYKICPTMHQMTRGIPRGSHSNYKVTDHDKRLPHRDSKSKSKKR